MRYFFHVCHENPTLDDTIGTDLLDDATAWEEATRACGTMIEEIDGHLFVGTDWKMKVHDEAGPLFEITFGAKRLR